ncbi:MAG TPA: hypothetical protein VH008_33390 [Pseudonocardia sp.]|nr:hypothetical protein [Pseudonocardia sp.]
MTSRSRQAVRLVELLRRRSGVQVECAWWGLGRDHRYSGWHLEWVDGPTEPEMRALVCEFKAQVPAIDAVGLHYDRSETELGKTVALLRYLCVRPEYAADATPVMASLAFDKISYPERSEEIWLYRAEALLLLDSSPVHPRLTAESLRELASRAELGWDEVLSWLDGITAGTG